MTLFRTALLRRSLAFLFLLTSLLSQAQVLFACDLMDGPPSPICCCSGDMTSGCGMGGGCTPEDGISVAQGCCERSVDTGSERAMGAASLPAAQVTLLQAPGPPPVPTDGAIVAPAFPRLSLPTTPARLPAKRRGARVYLVTNRLRI